MPANLTLLAPTPPRAPADVDAHAKRSLTVPMLVVSFILGSTVADYAVGPNPTMALVFPLILLPVLLWLHPRAAVYVLMGMALTVEQNTYTVGPRDGAVTSRIPLFTSVVGGMINPAELLIAFCVIVLIARSVLRRERLFYPSPVFKSLLVLMGLVLLYSGIGLARGGELNPMVWELRPYAYLFACFILASAHIRSFEDVRPLLWVLILCSGLKAVYGLEIFQTIRHAEPRPEAILSHEESFFFGLYLISVAAMWLFRFKDRIRTVATLLFPFVMLCNMVNSRRTAWLILIVGIAVVMLVALVRLREHRLTIATVLAAIAFGSAIYFPLFWSHSGALAQPARALRSASEPSQRDASSDSYREIETENLHYYIAESGSTGVGFGRPIHYFGGLVDLTDAAPLLAYIPHNNVLYQWWRMGLAGIAAMLVFISQGIISAARLTAARRPEVAMIGAIVAAMSFGYAGMGAVDLGFWWFRIAVVMGILFGIVDALTRARDLDEGSPESGVGTTAPAAVTGAPT